MQLALSTWSFSHSAAGVKAGLASAIERTIETGLGVELFLAWPDPAGLDRANWANIRAALDGCTPTIHSGCRFSKTVLTDEFELAAYLGAHVMVTHKVQWGPRDPELRKRYQEGLRDPDALDGYRLDEDYLQWALAMAESRGVQLLIENGTPEMCQIMLERYPQMGFCFDIGHAFNHEQAFPDDPIDSVLDRLGNHMRGVHVHDNSGRRDDHLPPGDATIPRATWEALGNCLRQHEYQGTIVMELRVPSPLDVVGRARTFLHGTGVLKPETD